ncbi:MAG: FAD-binding oxidoreductase [Rhodospirillales bacterium]
MTTLDAPSLAPSRFLGLTRSGIIVVGALTITTLLWVAGRLSLPLPPAFWPWLVASQIVMLWSFTCAAIALVAVVRAQALEPLFGGLDRAVKLHRRLGLAAFLLLVAHVIFLALHALQTVGSVGSILVPFWSPETRTIDILVFYALIALGLLAYDKRLRHERWLALHRLIGLLFLIGTGHASIEPGTIHDFEPLRTWVVILLLMGTTAWIYRIFLFRSFGPRYRYEVKEAKPRGSEVVDLVLRPHDRRMMYEPGTFVFLRVPSFPEQARELHPFSLSSSPVERDLRISARKIGDFTKRLPSLTPGLPVEVFGPFGSFTPQRFAPYRRMIWIGAGIGITPFLGMLSFELSNKDFRRIWLYYIARRPEDAPYHEEIESRFLKADSFIDYTLWTTADKGRLSATQIAAEVELDDYAVMICGQARFVSDMARQFHSLGLPHERIIKEELQFR